MAKHLVGFGLFALIVGVFVVISWIFTFPRQEGFKIGPGFEGSPRIGSYCDKKRPSRDVGSPRAIVDRLNGTVAIYINEIPGAYDDSSEEIKASFTFFAVSGDKVRVMDVVRDSLVRTVRRDAGTKWTLQYSVPWVRSISWDTNLYVVPSSDADVPAEFSVENAMPVLIRN